MFNILRGLIAGAVATFVAAIVILIKNALGINPTLSTMPLLADAVTNRDALIVSPLLGWVMHFVIFTILWSFVFALLAGKGSSYRPRTFSLLFSLFAWLIMMMVLMPWAGNGLFGLEAGLSTPVITLVLHLVWGWVLGFIYDLLPSAS